MSFSAYIPMYRGRDLVFEERLWIDDMGDYQVVDTLTVESLEALTGCSIEPRVHKRAVALPFSIDEAKEKGPGGAGTLWTRLFDRIRVDCRASGEIWSQTVFDARIHEGGALHDGELEDLAVAVAAEMWMACEEEEKDQLIVEVQNGAASQWRKLQRRGQ